MILLSKWTYTETVNSLLLMAPYNSPRHTLFCTVNHGIGQLPITFEYLLRVIFFRFFPYTSWSHYVFLFFFVVNLPKARYLLCYLPSCLMRGSVIRMWLPGEGKMTIERSLVCHFSSQGKMKVLPETLNVVVMQHMTIKTQKAKSNERALTKNRNLSKKSVQSLWKQCVSVLLSVCK